MRDHNGAWSMAGMAVGILTIPVTPIRSISVATSFQARQRARGVPDARRSQKDDEIQRTFESQQVQRGGASLESWSTPVRSSPI